MTSSRRLLWLGAVLGAAGVGVGVACSPSAKQLPPEAFTLPLYDGSTLTLTEDGGPGPTRVLVTNLAGPEAGVTVVYEDATGAVIGAPDTTDSLGRASRVLPAGSQVTVLLGDASAPEALTWVGVQPGDLLVALDTQALQYVYDQASIVSLPALPPPLDEAGTVLQYAVTAGPCQGFYPQPPPFDLAVSPVGCASPLGRFPLLVTAQDSSYQDVAFVYQRDNALAADGGTASVAVSGAWSTTFGNWSVTATNVPPTGNGGLVGFLSEVADDIPTTSTASGPGAIDGGSVPFTFRTHPGFADFVQTEVGINGGNAYTAIAVRSPAPAQNGSVSLDASQLLPMITNSTADLSTVPARPSMTWTYASGSGGSAGTIASVAWSDYDPDAGSNVYKEWTFVLPPNVTTVQAPSVPASAAAWVSQSTSSFAQSTVASVDTTTGFGADDFRHLAGSLPLPTANNLPYGQPMVPPLPADGATARITVYGAGG